jgi:hypothetical protein
LRGAQPPYDSGHTASNGIKGLKSKGHVGSGRLTPPAILPPVSHSSVHRGSVPGNGAQQALSASGKGDSGDQQRPISLLPPQWCDIVEGVLNTTNAHHENRCVMK